MACAGLVQGGGVQTGLGVETGVGAAGGAPLGGIVTLHHLAVARERLELPADTTTRYADEIKLMSACMTMTEIVRIRCDSY